MAIILGCSVIMVILSSKSLFRNHLFICGCALLLAGLSDKNSPPRLLFIQLSLVYFGAVFNKVFEADWWSGQFIYNWLGNSRENPFFISVSEFLPNMWFAKLLSWFSMLVEFSIAVLILIKKRHVMVAWIIILFHSVLYTIIFFRFGHFYEDIVIILLIFLIWPKEKINIYINKNVSVFFKQIFSFYFNNCYVIHDNASNIKNAYWLKIKTDSVDKINISALRYLLIFTPNFYLTLFIVDLLIRFLFNDIIMHLLHISILWIWIIFFISKFWKGKRPINTQIENGY
ncbi:hypothetical protein [Winogradskyella sp. PG-2]|uniref:hypothetical protein n=1 Tax=Winogradskyella sp. PG-2 TaxID=754409 RepID=UPI001494E831|nr:hypothetical protein [Winogradskyella sp. PG-2]